MADWPSGPPAVPEPGLRVGGAAYPAGPPEHWPSHVPPPPVPRPPAGPGAPPPLERRGGRTWGVVLAAVGVVAVLALVITGVGALVASTDGSDDEATDTTVDLSDPAITAPPSEEPVMPTMPSIPGLDPGGDPGAQARPLDEVLPDLVAFVEETRGQTFTTPPVVSAVPDAEFEERLADAQAEEVPDLEAAQVTGTALGLLPPGTDLPRVAAELAAVSVLGFYDPDTTELYVKGDEVTPFVQMIIVHELTHALDDQVFGLARLDDLAERPDESAFGFLALVEGTASYVQDTFRAQLSPEDATAVASEELELGFEQAPLAFSVPPAFVVQGQVPYASGQRFVEALVEEGGTAAIDAAYDAPPATSEQVLDVATYRAGEGAVALGPVEAGGAVVDEGAFGAADLRLLEIGSDPMAALVDPTAAELEPVPGFGGGRYASWTEGGASCVALALVGDDPAGSATIEDLVATWAESVGDAEVATRPGGTGVEVVTATRCA